MVFELGVALLDKTPKISRMVHLFSVTKLVHEHVIDKIMREFHERNIETNSTTATAAPPSTTGMRKPNALVVAIELGSQVRQPTG